MLARLIFFSDEPVNNAGTQQKRVARAEFFFAVFISVAPLMRRFAVQNIKNLEKRMIMKVIVPVTRNMRVQIGRLGSH